MKLLLDCPERCFTEPPNFATYAWSALIEAIKDERYYLSCDELLLVAHGAKQNLVVAKRIGLAGNFTVVGAVDNYDGDMQVSLNLLGEFGLFDGGKSDSQIQ